MTSAYLKYLKQLLVFSGILAAIALFLSIILPNRFLFPTLPFLFPFFIATSLLSYYYLIQTFTRRFIKFVNTFLLTIILKLVLYVGVMVTYLLVNRKDAIPFMLGFFILYLCYTIFEAVCIIKNTHPASPDTLNH